ncbi:Hypothetical predicted protein [Cloeon dipterum]|uniref:Uncharacterized protein n=1 Tax=Cloeon dipterum TaxID=197152 RepID=A0A8S1D9J1_9INSE|nr:Hypothetical predicted protein [Cloeon dipterum]
MDIALNTPCISPDDGAPPHSVHAWNFLANAFEQKFLQDETARQSAPKITQESNNKRQKMIIVRRYSMRLLENAPKNQQSCNMNQNRAVRPVWIDPRISNVGPNMPMGYSGLPRPGGIRQPGYFPYQNMRLYQGSGNYTPQPGKKTKIKSILISSPSKCKEHQINFNLWLSSISFRAVILHAIPFQRNYYFGSNFQLPTTVGNAEGRLNFN